MSLTNSIRIGRPQGVRKILPLAQLFIPAPTESHKSRARPICTSPLAISSDKCTVTAWSSGHLAKVYAYTKVKIQATKSRRFF